MLFRKIVVLIFVMAGAVFFIGCFGGDSDDKSPVLPTSYVTLNGTLTAPDKIESTLLGNTLNNVDSEVRNLYKTAFVSVNGTPISTFAVLSEAAGANWPIKIENVPQSSTANYKIAVVVGRITLRSTVRDSEKEKFQINLETTAAAMLAEVTRFEQHELLASYSAFVNTLKNVLVTSAQKTATEMTAGSIVNDSAVQSAMNTQKEHLESVADHTTNARLAYLQRENDLDGDGKIDLYVETNSTNETVRFYTVLSKDTSKFEDANSLDAYSDATLIADFADPAQLGQGRYFLPGENKTILGLYFKKSATGDQYLKMYIHRVDLAEGVLSGVLVEYSFVTANSTAISKGQKVIMLTGTPLVDGAVYATDFLTDSDEPAGLLSFIDSAKGLGNAEDSLMVVAFVGRPEIEEITIAPAWPGGGDYEFNTTRALESIAKSQLEVDDAFAAYFPATKHYALFKINSIAADRIVVDYIVNASEDERRFK